MTRNTHIGYFLLVALAALAGCSSEPATKQAAAPPDKIQGKAVVRLDESSGLDAALNAGGPSVYLVDGLNRYRLFFNKPFEVKAGEWYEAEGIYAQKAIDAIGDPAQGKNGYPLEASCGHVVRTAWPGLAFDVTDSYSNGLRAKVKRYPARPVFLVMKIQAAPADAPRRRRKTTRRKPRPSPFRRKRSRSAGGGADHFSRAVVGTRGRNGEMQSGGRRGRQDRGAEQRRAILRGGAVGSVQIQADAQGRETGKSDYRGRSEVRPAQVAMKCHSQAKACATLKKPPTIGSGFSGFSAISKACATSLIMGGTVHLLSLKGPFGKLFGLP